MEWKPPSRRLSLAARASRNPRSDRETARRLPDRDRRTRHRTLGWAEAAHRHCQSLAQVAKDIDLRWGRLKSRQSDGGALCEDDQQVQGEGDDDLQHASDS